jgi:hypothetical protein
MNEADTYRTHITLKLHAVRSDDDRIHEQMTFTGGHLVAYLDGLLAEVKALREL